MIKKIKFLLVMFCIAMIWAVPAIGSGSPSLGKAPLGTVDIMPNSLSGSVVTFDNGSQGYDACFIPGESQTFCFLAESYTNDYEYVYNLWVRFPGDWTVNDVWDNGPTVCTLDGGGTWGPFSWSFQTSPYEVNISHTRYQADTSLNSDYCYTYYCFDVVSGSGSPEALESWYWDGDDTGAVPHNPCSSDNYTPSGQAACDEAVNPQASISLCGPTFSLNPASTTASGCPRVVQTHTLTAVNRTGSPATADLTYNVISGDGMCGGPATIGPIADLGSEQFSVFIYPDCTSGGTVVCEVTATAGIYSDTTTISKQCVNGSWAEVAAEPDNGRMDNVVAAYSNLVWSITGYGVNADVRTYDPGTDTWTTIANSAPSFGINYARSGCTHGNKVYVYGDAGTVSFTGLWSYNMDTNTWAQETPGGTAPVETGIWAPAWVHDPVTGYCYLTGGATTPGGGNLSTVYVYDPITNAWLAQLPGFNTIRNFHAAFIYTSPVSEHKLLCVAGGVDAAGTAFSSTQCYDFTTEAWNTENADMGNLPAPWWGMGYADKLHLGTDHQLWMTAGLLLYGGITSQTYYYDVNSGTWVDGGQLTSGAVYRTSATTLNNEIYKLGGSSGGFTPQGWTDHHMQCSGCELISFTDIPPGFWAEDFIDAIACAGITTGCTLNPLNYCPSNNVTRQAMAAFIIRALYGEDFPYPATPYFSDVPDTNQFFKYVQKMRELNITTGCTATEYCPGNNVTRQAMAAFIIRALLGETFDYTATPYFIDVPDTSQFFKYVQKMKDERITTGCTATEYCPGANVTRASMAAFLARAFLGMK